MTERTTRHENNKQIRSWRGVQSKHCTVVSAGRVEGTIDRDFVGRFFWFYFLFTLFFSWFFGKHFSFGAIKELKKFHHLYRLYTLERPFFEFAAVTFEKIVKIKKKEKKKKKNTNKFKPQTHPFTREYARFVEFTCEFRLESFFDLLILLPRLKHFEFLAKWKIYCFYNVYCFFFLFRWPLFCVVCLNYKLHSCLPLIRIYCFPCILKWSYFSLFSNTWKKICHKTIKCIVNQIFMKFILNSHRIKVYLKFS